VLRAPGRGEHPAVLLLHVRHDPERRALADLGRAGAGPPDRDHGLPARICDPADHLRRADGRQAMGPPVVRIRPGTGHLVLDEELPDLTGGRRPGRAHPPFYDPIDTLPKAGQEWWRNMHPPVAVREAGNAAAVKSREAAARQDAEVG
jgi:hypothetical protein